MDTVGFPSDNWSGLWKCWSIKEISWCCAKVFEQCWEWSSVTTHKTTAVHTVKLDKIISLRLVSFSILILFLLNCLDTASQFIERSSRFGWAILYVLKYTKTKWKGIDHRGRLGKLSWHVTSQRGNFYQTVLADRLKSWASSNDVKFTLCCGPHFCRVHKQVRFYCTHKKDTQWNFFFSFLGCLAFWCFPCFACKTAHEAGECLCLPLLDSFGAIPPITLAMRVSIRQRYGIEVQTLCHSKSPCTCTSFLNACKPLINLY